MKTLDTLQTMHFRMDVQQMLLSYLEKVRSTTATNMTSPVNLPYASSCGCFRVPIMEQFSPQPYQSCGTPLRSVPMSTPHLFPHLFIERTHTSHRDLNIERLCVTVRLDRHSQYHFLCWFCTEYFSYLKLPCLHFASCLSVLMCVCLFLSHSLSQCVFICMFVCLCLCMSLHCVSMFCVSISAREPERERESNERERG